MNRVVIWIYGALMTILLTTAVYADRVAIKVTPGQLIYACNCLPSCPCGTLSKSKGHCSCGKELVPAKVTRVADGKAYLGEQERPYAIAGKYACPVSCNSGTISQRPGLCGCGRKLKKVS